MFSKTISAWNLMKIRNLLLVTLLMVALVGCSSTFHETHFFKSESQPNEIANYYRLTVSGTTIFSSSRYLSGYFDEEIVNDYFNEIGQPDKGKLIPIGQPKNEETKLSNSNSSVTTTAQSKSTQNTKNASLLLLLSSNSDEISNQLGALSQSQEFTASLTKLMAPSHFQADDAAASLLRIDKIRGHVLATLGDQILSSIPDNPDPKYLESRMLHFVNLLSADLGAPATFMSLKSASDWLRENRAQLRKENLP